MSVETLFCCTPWFVAKKRSSREVRFRQVCIPGTCISQHGHYRLGNFHGAANGTKMLDTLIHLQVQHLMKMRNMRGLVGWLVGEITWLTIRGKWRGVSHELERLILIYILCVHVFPCLNIPTGVRSAGFIDQPELQLLQLYITL